MVFFTCPKCKDEGFVICSNCDKFDQFEKIVTKNENSSVDESFALCSCGNQTDALECECGAVIYGKHFVIDKNKEFKLKQENKGADIQSVAEASKPPEELSPKRRLLWSATKGIIAGIVMFMIGVFLHFALLPFSQFFLGVGFLMTCGFGIYFFMILLMG